MTCASDRCTVCLHQKHELGKCIGAGPHRNVGGPQGRNLGCYCLGDDDPILVPPGAAAGATGA